MSVARNTGITAATGEIVAAALGRDLGPRLAVQLDAPLAMDATGLAVEGGRIADLLILTANPLEDVKNVGAIDAVIANGRVLDSERIRELRGRVGTPVVEPRR